MIKHYTEKELADVMKDLKIITDTREQVNKHITDYFSDCGIDTITRKLDVGDYSAQIGDMTFEKDFAIERKGSLEEICGNLTTDRERFEREFLRAKANGTKVYLIIEGADWGDVYLHNYRTKLSEKSLRASLFCWQTRFNVTILFAKKAYTPKLIYEIAYYSAREKLLQNK